MKCVYSCYHLQVNLSGKTTTGKQVQVSIPFIPGFYFVH